MSKQTAIEWLLEEWPILESQIPPRIIDQAKAMEEEQMIISDDDIESLAREHILYNDSKREWVMEGMKLYREQLKQKQ